MSREDTGGWEVTPTYERRKVPSAGVPAATRPVTEGAARREARKHEVKLDHMKAAGEIVIG